MAAIDELQAWVEDFLRERPDPQTIEESIAPGDRPVLRFSPFNHQHMARCREVEETLNAAADSAPGKEGLAAVREAAEAAVRGDEDPALVRHAVALFITHHAEGQRLQVPPLRRIAPEWVVPSRLRPEIEEGALPAGGAESALDWFREDDALNDHHIHWHRVYPIDGPQPGPAGAIRRGELFLYMHQQMLARYETERLAAGLPPVRPIEPPYDQLLSEGYDANIGTFADRPVDLRMTDSPLTDDLSAIAEWWPRLRKVATERQLRNGERGAVDGSDHFIDVLGSLTEDNPESRDQDYYGSYHNSGHVILAYAHFRATGNRNPGVMTSPATAMRDPIFYRWHKHVDSLASTFQDSLTAHNFAQDAPRARMRKRLGQAVAEHASPDLILCLLDNAVIQGSEDPAWDGQAFGERTFGGDKWDTDFTSAAPATDTLLTTTNQREIVLSDGRIVTAPHLDLHKEFAQFIRVENLLDAPQRVTVRIFLAATQVAGQRRMWMEMDKFQYTLRPKAKEVIFRPSGLSAVVRQSTVKSRLPEQGPISGYCDCGWPYNLFLPKGRAEGMAFRLFVMLTDAEQDLVDIHCGSTSFCGARNRAYPDRRPMGYPFDREFATSISDTFKNHDNMASRGLTIKYVGG